MSSTSSNNRDLFFLRSCSTAKFTSEKEAFQPTAVDFFSRPPNIVKALWKHFQVGAARSHHAQARGPNLAHQKVGVVGSTRGQSQTQAAFAPLVPLGATLLSLLWTTAAADADAKELLCTDPFTSPRRTGDYGSPLGTRSMNESLAMLRNHILSVCEGIRSGGSCGLLPDSDSFQGLSEGAR